MERTTLLGKNTGIGKTGMNILLYLVTLVIVCLFVYFIYKFIYVGSAFQSNVILDKQVSANDPGTNGKQDITTIPVIYEGGEFTLNFWIYIAGYQKQMGQRKHLVELRPISSNNTDDVFSTIKRTGW